MEDGTGREGAMGGWGREGERGGSEESMMRGRVGSRWRKGGRVEAGKA